MKRIFAILALCSLFMFTGCGSKTSKYEETMKDYAIDYYNSLLKGTEGKYTFEISIAKLKRAVDNQIVNYDMSKLSSCTDESYVELIINKTNSEVDSVNYHMSCGE